jgi:hypothetical protein
VVLAQYRDARRQLNATLDLLSEAIELRQRLWWQPDLDEARRQADDFRRAIENFKRARGERGRRP